MSASYVRQLAHDYAHLGKLLHKTARVDEAQETYQRSVKLIEGVKMLTAGATSGDAPLGSKSRTNRVSSYEQIKTTTELDPAAIDELFADLDNVLIQQW